MSTSIALSYMLPSKPASQSPPTIGKSRGTSQRDVGTSNGLTAPVAVQVDHLASQEVLAISKLSKTEFNISLFLAQPSSLRHCGQSGRNLEADQSAHEQCLVNLS